MKSRFSTLFFALSIITAAIASGDAKKEEKKPKPFQEAVFDGMRTFAEIFQYVDQRHYKVSDPERSINKAYEGFLNDIDPHSTFFDQETYKQLLETTSGEFFGIGIVIDNTRQAKDKFLLVVDIIPDGPADKAGVKAFDKIVEIDGQPLEDMRTEEATAKLKGERNTKVHIKILRENHPDIISLDITRDEIKEQSSLCFYLPKQQVYYLSLSVFSDSAVQQLEKLLNSIKKNTFKGLILDLRNNSGGLLTAGIDIAGLFLEKGSLVVSTKGKGNKEMEKYVTNKTPIANNTIPIFILINNYTASAAEILAGSLKIHSDMLAQKAGKKEQKKLMVFLVGTRTFGKGSVQEVVPLSDNRAMKITMALYYLPQDVSIQGSGIEPDFAIEKKLPPTEQMIWFNKYYGSEKALANSIKPEKEGEKDKAKEEEAKKKEAEKNKKEKNWTERAKDVLEKDNQFRETITLINIFHEAQTHCPNNVCNRNVAVDFMKKTYVSSDPLVLEEVKI